MARAYVRSSTSPLALLVVAFIVILAYVVLNGRSKGKSKAQNGSSPDPANEIDYDDISRRVPRKTSSSGTEHGGLQPDTPADPSHTAHPSIEETYGLGQPLIYTPGKPARSGLYDGKTRRNSDYEQKVRFHDNGGTAATRVASRPADLQSTNDFRIWDDPDYMEAKRKKGDTERADGVPVNALDGSSSLLPLLGEIDEYKPFLAEMARIEKLCRKDWFSPKLRGVIFNARLEDMLKNDWIPPFGNVPSVMVRIVEQLCPLFGDLSLARAIPEHDIWTPATIEAQSGAKVRDLLLAYFVLPFRAYVKMEWSRSEMAPVPHKRILRWLEYMGRPFRIARMFSGRMAEVFDDSLRVGISINPEVEGYIADVTLFTPLHETAQWKRRHPIRDAVANCLILARNWIETKYPGRRSCSWILRDLDGGAKGYKLRFGDPLQHFRLTIRPGFSIEDASTGTWDPAESATAPSQIVRHPQILALNLANINACLKDEQRAASEFLELVGVLHPTSLTFHNERQNSWHPSQKNLRFDKSSLEFMFALCLSLTRPNLRMDCIEFVDFGGIMPLVDRAFDLQYFKAIKTVVLPYLAASDPVQTAVLLFDDRWGLQSCLLDGLVIVFVLRDDDPSALDVAKEFMAALAGQREALIAAVAKNVHLIPENLAQPQSIPFPSAALRDFGFDPSKISPVSPL